MTELAMLLWLLTTTTGTHTITFDEVEDAGEYHVYIKTVLENPWTQMVGVCVGSPCTVELHTPTWPNVVFVNVVAVE